MTGILTVTMNINRSRPPMAAERVSYACVVSLYVVYYQVMVKYVVNIPMNLELC